MSHEHCRKDSCGYCSAEKYSDEVQKKDAEIARLKAEIERKDAKIQRVVNSSEYHSNLPRTLSIKIDALRSEVEG